MTSALHVIPGWTEANESAQWKNTTPSDNEIAQQKNTAICDHDEK